MTVRTTIVILILAGALGLPVRPAAAGEGDHPEVRENRSLVALQAQKAEGRSSDTRKAGRNGEIIEVWRDRVFASLGGMLVPVPARAGTGADASESAGQENQERMVARAAVKETVKLALERMPEVERVVKALRIEVSTDQFLDGEPGPTVDDAVPASPADGSRSAAPQKRFFMKTGLRIPIDNAKPGLLSETSAVYGSFSSFFKVRLDGRNDARLGMRYDLSPDVHLQLERQVAGEGGVYQTVQLVCAF